MKNEKIIYTMLGAAVATLIWVFAVIVGLSISILNVQAAEGERVPPCRETAPAVACAEVEDDPRCDLPAIDPVEADMTRIDGVTLTHYCVCARCCGRQTGVTRSGRDAIAEYSVAVDPSIIPLGATVVIEYPDGTRQWCRADDTGSGVRGAHIDLCVAGHEDALKRGVETVTVWWEVTER